MKRDPQVFRTLIGTVAALAVVGLAITARARVSTPVRQAADSHLVSSGRIAILGYHEVEETPIEGWSVRTDDFEAQLNFLARTGWTVIPLQELYEFVTGKRSALPERSIVITVDDGWLCTKTDMEPRFRQHGFPFTLFVYPKILGHGTHALTWGDVETMAANGVDVESHTMTHPHLNRTSQATKTDEEYASWLENELAAGKETIEKAIGKPVTFLAYPYGEHDAAIHAAVAKYGYRAAVTSQTTQPDFNARGTDPYQLRRFVVDSSTTLDRFRRSLGGADLLLEEISPALDTPIATGQNRVSARIRNPGSVIASSVHIASLTADAVTPRYDATSGTVSAMFDRPLAVGREQIAVWADDATTGERRTAVWTFYRSKQDKVEDEAKAALLGNLPFHHPAVKP